MDPLTTVYVVVADYGNSQEAEEQIVGVSLSGLRAEAQRQLALSGTLPSRPYKAVRARVQQFIPLEQIIP